MTRIAIIGGGIGGLSAALALRQSGFEPEVFEQAPALLEVGAAIAVWPNAMRVLQKLGISERVIEKAGAIKQVCWLDWHGRRLNHVRFTETRAANAPAVALRRADLQGALFQALPASSIKLGTVFVSYEREKDEIRARFADGQTIACDLLIGADGLHSRVRAQLVGDVQPVYRGYSVWRGVTRYTPPGLMPETAVEIQGLGKRFGIGPVGTGRTGWWATANDRENMNAGQNASRNATEKEYSDITRCKLLTLFAGSYRPVVELIEETQANSILRNDATDLQPTRNWGRGAMTLLGDAIHATTPNLGQGGCMAIEDALILSRCLRKYGGHAKTFSVSSVNSALRRYERLRYSRTAAIARYSRRYGIVGQWESIMATRLRGLTLSMVPEALLRRLLQLIFNYDANSVSV